MALTDKQIAARDGKLTASRVACLMTGDKEKILNLWRELVGDPSYEPEDLDWIWAVRLGEVTEDLNLAWYEKKYGPLSRRREVVTHDCGWAAATLDGWDTVRGCPVETKHVGGFEKFSAIIDRYQPQMHWQMLCTNAKECALSVIEGAREPNVEFVKFDADYAAELWKRASEFMACVRELRPPFVAAAVAPPVKPTKEYDLTGNNAWASAAAQWLENRVAAKHYGEANEGLKKMMPPDAVRAFGHKVEAKRDKAGKIRIGET